MSKKIYLFSFLFLLFFWKGLNLIKANQEFKIDQKIIYKIEGRGDGRVNHQIKLTNNFSNIYPKEFHIQLGTTGLKNISATDKVGNIIQEISEENNKTIIKTVFNEKVVGKGESLNFEISYFLPNLAEKKGQIWEINIPTINDIENYENFLLEIEIPLSFGKLAYHSIVPHQEKKTENNTVIEYTKEEVKNGGIVLTFGEFQLLDFSLNFFLSNPLKERVKTYIALPPETPFQSIIFTKIEPKPEKITTDEDLNWLANYTLSPNQSLEIKAEGQAKIFSKPENIFSLELARKRNNNLQNYSLYLKEDKYWEINHPIFKEINLKKNNPESIYQFVRDTLEYDYQNLEENQRKGAVKAFIEKRGVCTEFADLFVTLARKNKIPARELEGFALTSNQKILSLSLESDVLHSWADYWNNSQKMWLPVDPTWEKTTGGMDFLTNFDLSHFVFVIHGVKSDSPVPPGFYKKNNQNKNINVEFANQPITNPEPEFEVSLTEKSLKGDNQKNNSNNWFLLIKNNSLAPIYSLKFSLKNLEEKILKEGEIDFLPPLGEEVISFPKPSFFLRLFKKLKWKITLGDKTFFVSAPPLKLNFSSIFDRLK